MRRGVVDFRVFLIIVSLGVAAVAGCEQSPGATADSALDEQPLPRGPDIAVDRHTLDFGVVAMNAEATRTLIVSNVGDEDLEITAVLVDEVDLLREFRATPEGPLDPPLVLAPDATTLVTVALRPADAQPDVGALRISSNDPDEAIVNVSLRSALPAWGVAEACVLDLTLPAPGPTPFEHCVVDNLQGDPLIDFGVSAYGQDASQLIAVRNVSTEGFPLTLEHIGVTDFFGAADHFSHSAFFYSAGIGSPEMPAVLPITLLPDDPLNPQAEDRLFIRLWYDNAHDGPVPREFLTLRSAGAGGELAIPITGVVCGCPPGTWDLNGDCGDGCEYLCDDSGPETCDSSDNDCDGLIDEEDALGCTIYHRDLDGDAFGQTADQRCLCAPDLINRYSATADGDCDDNSMLIHPGMLESCSTLFDDNCNGLSNEPGAVGCTDWFRDRDGDGFGLTVDASCLCGPLGDYQAAVGGDCDDLNPGAHPAQSEDCNTLFDDDCNGEGNDDGALGCSSWYLDADGDGFGLAAIWRCLCAAEGDYDATAVGDCNDASALVHPLQPENCQTASDDDCNGETNEASALGCQPYYADADGDSYGSDASSVCQCRPSSSHPDVRGGDCADLNTAINPGATEVCDGVDNNCMDGVDEGFDLLTDLDNCGWCNIQCVNPHGSTSCVGGSCQPVCDPDWGNCDGIDVNGCELSTVGLFSCGDCQLDDDCMPGWYCGLGAFICVRKQDLGEPCSRAAACLSGFCADGVCCNDSCTGLCRDCNLAGQEGSCTLQPANTDPEVECALCQVCDGAGFCRNVEDGSDIKDDCAATAPSICDLDGSCDGSGACRLFAAGTECRAPSCVGGVQELADSCDGGGLCADNGMLPCEPLVCDASGLGCLSSCGNDADCHPAYYCQLPQGQCVAKIIDGPCLDGSECMTGLCVDGVCCDTPCTGTCRACNLAGQEGSCTLQPANTDPEVECALCQVCDGAGFCQNVEDGSDIKDDCAAEAASSCDLDGECDGSGACRLYDVGTECRAPTCVAGFRELRDNCDGGGLCTDSGMIPCEPFVCDASGLGCLSSCGTATDCHVGYACQLLTGQCQVKIIEVNCVDGSECLSGFCAEGVCCDAPCTGPCRACNLAGMEGSCVFHPANWDPDAECAPCQTCDGSGFCKNAENGSDIKNDCTATAASSCDLDGSCDGSGACRLYAAGTECAASSCVGGVQEAADSCDGTGLCLDGGMIPCEPNACDASGLGCLSSCGNDADCHPAYYCQLPQGQCVAKIIDGPCLDGSECISGFCADGVCCDAPCTGPCRACNLFLLEGSCTLQPAGTDPEIDCGTCQACSAGGTCTNLPGGAVPLQGECDASPLSSCGNDGFCNAFGACRQYAAGTFCAPADCVGDWQRYWECDGFGSACAPRSLQSCGSYTCENGSCRFFCETDDDCALNLTCVEPTCFGLKECGGGCLSDTECLSAMCVDGVCCSSLCDGPCETCGPLPNLWDWGTCKDQDMGTDPDNDCLACQACNGAGSCAPAGMGTDPKDDCTAEVPDTCGTDGQCDGLGGCRFWPENTPCGTVTCNGTTLAEGDLCVAPWTCQADTLHDCHPFLCSAGTCSEPCLTSADCSSGFTCDASQECAP